MNKRLVIALLLVPVLSLAACKRAPLVNVESAPLGAPASATLDQVAEAIRRAANSLGWELTERSPGHFVGRLVVAGKHTAVASITYDTRIFSIIYESSNNLNFKVERAVTYIHPNYMVWVGRLKQRIQTEASTI